MTSSLTAGVAVLPAGPDGRGRAITIGGRGIIYKTADGGQTWEITGRMPIRLGDGTHYTRLLRLGPDGHLWVTTTINGTAREWIYRSLEPAVTAFGVATEPTPEPTGAVRLAVHPNPAGATATVTVEVAAPVPYAVASVYDALGRRIAVLHDGPLSAGLHDFTLDVSALAPGVYVVRLDEGRTTHTARLTTIGR